MKITRSARTVTSFGPWLTFALPLSADTLTASTPDKAQNTRLREAREVKRLNAMYQMHRDREYRAHRDQIEDDLPAVSVKPPVFTPEKQAPRVLLDLRPRD